MIRSKPRFDIRHGLLLIALVLLPALGLGQECADYVDTVDFLGGYPTASRTIAVAVEAGCAVVSCENGEVLVLDVSDPGSPVPLGSIALGGQAIDLVMDGAYVYLGLEGYGLNVVDIADPTNPLLVSTFAAPGGGARLTVIGTAVLIADGSLGALAVDVTDPAVPVSIGTFVAPDDVLDVKAVGQYALLATDDDCLRVVDYSDPSAPVEVAHLVDPNTGVEYESHYDRLSPCGDRLVASHWNWDLYYDGMGWFHVQRRGIRIIDIGDPTAPVLGGYIDRPFAGAARIGDHLALADNGPGYYSYAEVWLYDATDAGNPFAVGTMNVPDLVANLASAGDIVFAADRDGLWAIDATTPYSPQPIAVFGHLVAGQWGARTYSEWSGTFGMSYVDIYDVTDPTAPLLVDGFSKSLDPYDPIGYSLYSIQGDYFCHSHSVDPFAITVRRLGASPGVCSLPLEAAAHVFAGDVFFIAASPGLRVFDLVDMSAPVEYGAITLPATATALTVQGNLLFAATADGTIRVFDVTDPAAPAAGAEVTLPGSVVGLTCGDGLLYATCAGEGLRVLDLGDPAVPVPVGDLVATTHSTPRVAPADRQVYVSGYRDGLELYDFTDPASPIYRGRAACGIVTRVAWSGDLIWASGPFMPQQCPEDLTAAPDPLETPAASISLIRIYPNPFNPEVAVFFTLDRPLRAELAVFDLRGRRWATLVDGAELSAGPHAVSWNGRDRAGREAPSGVYLLRLVAGGTVQVEKAVMVR